MIKMAERFILGKTGSASRLKTLRRQYLRPFAGVVSNQI